MDYVPYTCAKPEGKGDMRRRWWYLASALVLITSVVSAVWLVKDPIDRSCRGQSPCDVSGEATTGWRLAVVILGVLLALVLVAVGAIVGDGSDDHLDRAGRRRASNDVGRE